MLAGSDCEHVPKYFTYKMCMNSIIYSGYKHAVNRIKYVRTHIHKIVLMQF